MPFFIRKYFFLIALLPSLLIAQQKASVYGTLKTKNGEPIEGASIAIYGKPGGTTSDNKGNFSLSFSANTDVTLVISFVGFNTIKEIINLPQGTKKELVFEMEKSNYILPELTIEEEKNRGTNMQTINPKLVNKIASPSGSFEAILKTLPGVSSNNELSSQYSVRGGNFDENLIYVNDVEIYRPFLVRSGQQEGLSFINPGMVESVNFSAGGFDAKYGDKLSSVLDVKYKEPLETAASATLTLQGASFHFEGSPGNHRFTHITGVRYRSNQYVLKSLDTDGDYKPSFFDFQTYLTYDISEKWEISFLGNSARNHYNFIPKSRQTEFGTINQALRLSIYFEGQEYDKFETYFGALTNTWKPSDKLTLKLITSAFVSFEDETFDIDGYYLIDELERDLSKDNFGDVAFNRGVGGYLQHARNYLDAKVGNVEHKGKFNRKNSTLDWGVKFQHEEINDELNEWNMLDSAGYSVPHPPDSIGYTNPLVQPNQEIIFPYVLKANISMQSNRAITYLQQSWWWETSDSAKITLTAGLRANYWDFNNETVVSPRSTISLKPNWKKDFLFRFSSGFYYQPPFYRELRNFNGTLNKNIKAQQSIHFVLGSDRNFKAWNRPFKWTTELYYKILNNVIPYELDNVRIRYYAKNNAKAYATGIDFKINGEFVKGVDSWASLSVMQTKEDVLDDYYVDYYNSDGEKIIPGYSINNIATDSVITKPGYIPRPTDQRVNFSLFFQDYVPMVPSLKMYLTLYFGSSLPFGPPSYERYKDTLRMPPYRRVDLGFSYDLLKEGKQWKEGSKNPFRKFKSIWASIEVFNLLQINNTISYLWVKDVTNRTYAVPNYLTSRQLNLKLHFEF
jgi:hypothetical protein